MESNYDLYDFEESRQEPWGDDDDDTIKYAFGDVIHSCQSCEVHPGITLVWTDCEIDVPANRAHRGGDEAPDCPACSTAQSEDQP